jgi:hypothetical protein
VESEGMEDGRWKMEDVGMHCNAMLLLIVGYIILSTLMIKAFRKKSIPKLFIIHY